VTIRAKLKLWYALMAVSGVLLLALAFFYEIVIEGHLLAEGIWSMVSEILFWTGIPAAILIFGGWAWLGVMRRSMRTLEDLTRAAESINTGDFRGRIAPGRSGDELDRLARAFNAMLDRIEASVRQVREFTLETSHELKTPLAIMRPELESALAEPLLPPPARERLPAQLEEIDRLCQMVDQLSLIAQAGAGTLQPAGDPVPLHQLVSDTVEDAEVLAHPKGVRVTREQIEECVIPGSRDLLRQLLLNLTDNAVKYVNPGGEVVVGLHRRGSEAVFTIRNTGPGLAPELQARVFDRFFRGQPPSVSNTCRGTGLGLAIARALVEAHGGKITFHSIPGEWTTLTVALPLTQTA